VRRRPDGRWDAEHTSGDKRVVRRDFASEAEADEWLEAERLKQRRKKRRSRSSTWGTVLSSPTGYRIRHPRPSGGPPVNRPERFEFKRDADAFLASLRVQAGKGLLTDGLSDETVLDFAMGWLATASVRGSTHDKYTQYVARYIAPVPVRGESSDGRSRKESPYLATTLAHTPLRKLTADQVGRWFAAIRADVPTTAAGAYRLLSTMCKDAVRLGRIDSSPCVIRGAHKESVPESRTVPISAITRLADAVPAKLRAAVLLGAWCALRREEVLGLQVGDVDLSDVDYPRLTIRRSWTRGRGVLGAGPTKNGDERTVDVPTPAVDALRHHLTEYAGSVWLFPGDKGAVDPQVLDRQWRKATVALGLPAYRFHELRHTALTNFGKTGATVAEIKSFGGHSTIAAAARYWHDTGERSRELAIRLGSMAETQESG
jgi:integrase